MTMHLTWTLSGTVDDLYRPGAIRAAAGDSLERVAARLQAKDVSALVILDGYRGVRHLPVVVGGEVTGMVSTRDLLQPQSAPTP